MNRVNFARIQSAVDLLDDIAPEDRLSALKNMTINNGGRWDFPTERHGFDKPSCYEMTLFGVSALSYNFEELPKNWLIAANNMLQADAEDKSGAAA